MAYQFVVGETLEGAWKASSANNTYSFDMLGEAALTDTDAEVYYQRYWEAVDFLATKRDVPKPSTLSIKLSALHARYELHHVDHVYNTLLPKLLKLVQHAAQSGVPVTIDAEEADRLELCLHLYRRVYQSLKRSEKGYLGIAVQAYQKRAPYVLDFLAELARSSGIPMPVRLVKGAYWDQEVKWSQQRGLPDYPVHIDKSHTDISYLVCAQKMLSQPEVFFPQFATHNPHAIACIMDLAKGDFSKFEFQRLFGMGDGVYSALQRAYPDASCRVYAPVGQFDQLLPYLVRRMIENGANTSFVNALGNRKATKEDDKKLLSDPWDMVPDLTVDSIVPPIPLPPDLYGSDESSRRNSKAVNTGSSEELHESMAQISSFQDRVWIAQPHVAGANAGLAVTTSSVLDSVGITGGKSGSSVNNQQPPQSVSEGMRAVATPANTAKVIGYAAEADEKTILQALDNAASYYKTWQLTDVAERVEMIETAADLLEEHSSEFMYILMNEAGKTYNNAQNEIREAVDFLRYYSEQALLLCAPIDCASVTGEKNTLIRQGLGPFVCVSPWNFPLAIFIGQISAALLSGNTVIAKSAPETPIIAHRMIELMYESGVPTKALSLVPASPQHYDELVWSDPRVRGVAFTGSTKAALHINRQLALRENAPIAKVVAETGGQNAMIVDSSALLDQAVADTVESSFDSAGQRCSAARVVYVQKDAYKLFKEKLKGRMDTLLNGDPCYLPTDVGPVISQRARDNLTAHIERLRSQGHEVYQCDDSNNPNKDCGYFIAPTLIEINHISDIGEEQFGPILHLIKYNKNQLNDVVEEINSTGYGLTFGIHTRVDQRVEHLIKHIDAGNIYVNRNIVGAVVESQPFGGRGLSGTGPKAGGPDYLLAFLGGSKTISDNIAAKGGDPALFSMVSERPDVTAAAVIAEAEIVTPHPTIGYRPNLTGKN